MDQITHDVRHENWAQIVEACNASGLSRSDWCQQNGVSLKSFYYHQRVLRQQARSLQLSERASQTTEVSFVELPLVEQPIKQPVLETVFRPDAVIKTSTLTIEVSKDVSPELLSMIKAVLKHAT